MKRLFILLLCLFSATANAQTNANADPYLNRKTLSIGYGMNGLEVSSLNNMLRQVGYPDMDNNVSVGNVSVSTDFGPRWGVFYAMDFSAQQETRMAAKYSRFQYYRFYAGIESSAFRQERFELLGRVALSYSAAAIRLYDTLADTNSFTRYLGGAADAKRFTAGSFGFDVGFQSRFRITNMMFLGLGSGYIISAGNAEWKHDAGSFDGAPNAGLSSWYVGVKAGVLFHRRITRVSPLDFEQGKKDETGLRINTL